jgi:CHAT domain-containing protein
MSLPSKTYSIAKLPQFLRSIVWVAVLCWGIAPNGLSAQTLDKQEAVKEYSKILENWRKAAKPAAQYETTASLARLLQHAELGWAHADSLKIEWHLQLGLWYDQLGEKWKACQNYRISKNLLANSDTLDSASLQKMILVSGSLAHNLGALGMYKEANAQIESALNLTDSMSVGYADLLEASAGLHSAGRNHSEAIKHLRRAISLRKMLVKTAKDAPLKALRTTQSFAATVELAEAFNRWNKPDSAFKYLEQVPRDASNMPPQLMAKAWIAIAHQHALKGEESPAWESVEFALEYAKSDSTSTQQWIGEIQTLLAKFMVADRRSYETLDACQNALISLVPTFEDTLTALNPVKTLWNREIAVFELLIYKSRAFEEIGLYEQALRCSENAFDYLDHLREQGWAVPVNYFADNDLHLTYEFAISLALKHAAQTRAATDYERVFNLMERCKTNEILRSMQQAVDVPAYILPDSLLCKWRANQARSLDNHRHPSKNSPEILSRLQQQAIQLRMAMDTISPAFAAYTQPFSPVNVAEVQRTLKSDEVFLSYFIGASQVFIFAIDQQHAQCFASPKHPKFDASVGKFLDMLKQKPEGRISKLFSNYERIAFFLFGELIGPLIRENFRGRIPRSLIIVPDGKLAMLPFECLVTQRLKTPSENAFQHAAYLQRDCEIRYGHSATTLARQNRPARHAPLAFQRSILAMSASPKGLEPLASARSECKEVADVLNGKSMNQLSKADFKENSGDYNFLHFAAAAFADSLDPLRSWIAFQKEDQSIDTLFASEILALRLSAEMVMLSAIETRSKQHLSGENLMGIARSFAVAGCPRTMLSLWNSNDEVASALIGNFYKTMKVGKPAAQAMREARQAYLQAEAGNDPLKYHPHYWASVVMVGEEGPYLTQGPKSWTPYLVWGSIAALIVALWQRRRRRRRRKGH